MPPQPAAVIFGGTRIGNRGAFMPEHGLEKFFHVLAVHNVTTIDTAQSYGNSEATIGRVRAGDRFTVDSKWSPNWIEPEKAWATRDQIRKSAKDSIQKLRVEQVDVFYLHRPDPKTPIAETLSAVNDVYVWGMFRRLGLSGFPAAEVERIYDYCVEHDYPLPTVYQGSYNPISRHKETGLLPTLRKLGISFYAYGTSAGGFLGKTVNKAEEMSRDLEAVSATCRPYVGSSKFWEILSQWNIIAEGEGVSGAELAYRWIAYHSALSRDDGDAMIINASSPEQLDETLTAIDEGPLSNTACSAIHAIWQNLTGESEEAS